MNKQLQDLAWSVLPKEFKEEVKKLYSHNPGAKAMPESTSRGKSILRDIFGHDNLTSDADGEEMLIVERLKIQYLYSKYSELNNDEPSAKYGAYYKDRIEMLYGLFGSKCLPDNVDSLSQNPPENCDNRNLISTDDNKPIGPKYHKGEKVCYNGYVYEIEGLVGKNRYALKGLNFDLHEDMIDPYEPYTEPEEETTQNVNHSDINIDELVAKGYVADPAKQLDNILKDSFRSERRLNIAAMAMQGMLTRIDDTPQVIANAAFRYADALIAECEEGGVK